MGQKGHIMVQKGLKMQTAKNWDSWKRAHLPPKPPPKVREVLANGYDDDDDHHGPLTPEGEHFPPTAAPH